MKNKHSALPIRLVMRGAQTEANPIAFDQEQMISFKLQRLSAKFSIAGSHLRMPACTNMVNTFY